MLKKPYLILLFLICAFVCATAAYAQDSSGVFRTKPLEFFESAASGKWVGTGTYLMTEYADTLVVSRDSAGTGAVVRRVLVEIEPPKVVSRGNGTIRPLPGDSI